jgi:hypothetical protein
MIGKGVAVERGGERHSCTGIVNFRSDAVLTTTNDNAKTPLTVFQTFHGLQFLND